tara:strand:- start:102 stop:419 length:318 start_codon:yes stop_codon:yes gene_type:complete
MKNKKTAFIISVIFLVTSCAESFDSVKRGITGAKRKSADEFLVKKKDPLTLPPDYENLPTPAEKIAESKEDEIIKKKLKSVDNTIEKSKRASSAEKSIIDQIRNK